MSMTDKSLRFIGTITIPARPRFIATKHYEVNTRDGVVVKINYMWGDFKSLLDKVEEAIGETELAVYQLTKKRSDKDIRAELGENKEETRLYHLWSLLEKQGYGERGKLLVNGCANIFYIRDIAGILWTVGARWSAYHGGWRLSARLASASFKWRSGYRVVSLN